MSGIPLSAAHASRALAVASFTQLVVVLDGAVLIIALPSLAADMHVSVANLPWVANAYAIPLAGLLLLGGRITDLFGAIACLRIGLVVFALASLGAGLAPTFEVLLAFRVFQAIGAALLSPASLALLTGSTLPGIERERAIAIWSVTAGVGGTVGALVGGALTQLLDWRWTLLINVVIAPVILALTRNLGHARHVSGERLRHSHFDIPGALLFIGGVGGIILAITETLLAPARLAAALAGIVCLVAFVLVESRASHPILPLRLLRMARVGLTNAAAFLLIAGLAVTGFYTSLYAQEVSGLTPFQTALLLLPSAIAGFVMSRLVPRLVARFGERAVRTTSPMLASVALAGLAVLAIFQPPFAAMVPLLVLQAMGSSASVIVLTSASTRSLPRHQSGLAGALITTSGQLGSSIGLALLTGLAAAIIGGGQASLSTLDHRSIALQMTVAMGMGAVVTVAAGLTARTIPLGSATSS